MIKNNDSIKRINFIYLISLIPLILFGFYKNGINLYYKKYVGIYGLFKPLILVISGFIIGIIINIIYEKIIKKNKMSLKDAIFSSFHPLYGLLIGGISSINISIITFTLVTFIMLFISKFLKYKINYVALTSLILFFIMNIKGEFSFLNIYESSRNFNLNTLDYLLGKGSGGIITTNILLLLVSFLILYLSKTYKKNIPIYSTITFTILVIIYCLYKGSIGSIMDMLFTNGILFAFIFIATDSISSSYTKKGMVIYGIFVGLITFGLYLINPALSSLGAILIASILNSVIDLKFE